jgi:hypothetical protein
MMSKMKTWKQHNNNENKSCEKKGRNNIAVVTTIHMKYKMKKEETKIIITIIINNYD